MEVRNAAAYGVRLAGGAELDMAAVVARKNRVVATLERGVAGLLKRTGVEVIRGQAERFDAFASLPHYPFPGGRLFRVPFTALGAAYYDLRDKLGL